MNGITFTLAGEFFPSQHRDSVIDETRMVDGDCEKEPVKVQPFALSHQAYYGLFGEMLSVVESETEAHPASILLSWLTLFGNGA